MQILNIAGYRFIKLNDLEKLRANFQKLGAALALKGTILLSHEGINISLAGAVSAMQDFKDFLQQDERFKAIAFHETYSHAQSFQHFKVKLKKEIITLKRPEINPAQVRAPSIAPEAFKQWLDEERDFTLIDTRNEYEIGFGTFKGAMNLHIADFSDLPSKLNNLDKHKPVVMFCTGGIRCEKAALLMLNEGFSAVYQLEGGILGYFAKTGGEHYEGECFVFDERVALNTNLESAGTVQCRACQSPVTKAQQSLPTYQQDLSCPSCA